MTPIILAEPDDTIAAMDLESLRGPVVETQVARPPELTPQIIRDVVADLIDIEAANGIHEIARAHGIWPAQVRQIDRARLARIAELSAAAEPGDLEPKR